MISAVHGLNIVLPIFYLITFVGYVFDFVNEKSPLQNSKRIFLFLTVTIHVFYLLARTIEFNHPPITNKFEIFTVLAFALSFSYFLLELLTDIRGTGIFIILISLIFQLVSTAFIKDLFDVKEILRNRLLGLHVISALLGYSGITISAVHGTLFLMLYNALKSNRFGLIFNRLPNLEILEKLCFYAMVIGFLLLTISITIGIVWLPQAFPKFSYADPKLITTGLVWIIYGVGLLIRIFSNLYGRKLVLFSIFGFVTAMISLVLGNILATSFHTFY